MRFARFAAFVAAGFVVTLARSVHASQRFSFWGEDGHIFTQQARASGLVHSFFTTYAGYFLFLPRIVAAIVSAFPLEWSPPMYAVAAILMSSAVAAMAYRACREGLGLPVGAALAVWGTVLLLPAVGPETSSDLTNIEWYCLAGVLVYVVAWFEGWQTNPILTGTLLFLAATTTPLALLVCAFVAVRLGRQHVVGTAADGGRSRRGDWGHNLHHWRPLDLAVLGGLGGGIAVTWLGYLLDPDHVPVESIELHRLVAMYAIRVVDATVLGDRPITATFSALGETCTVVIGLVLVLALLIAALRDKRNTSLMLIGTSFLVFVLPSIVRGVGNLTNLGFTSAGPAMEGRYMGVPALCLVLALLLALRPSDRSEIPSRTATGGRVMTFAAGALAVMLVFNVPIDLQRQPLHSWEHDVHQGQQACRAHGGHGVIAIPNAPATYRFKLQLTCGQAFGD